MAALCSVEGCDKARHYTNGLCPMHYQRLRKNGTTDAIVKPRKVSPRRVGIEPCEVSGCEKPIRARGWCVAHYSRWERHGSPTARLAGEVVDGKKICSRCREDQPLDRYSKQGKASLCKPCEADYQREYLAANPRPPKVRVPMECLVCNRLYMGNNRQRSHCSAECRAIGERDMIRRYTHERRAALKGRPAESFVSRDVFKRDGWTCGLCGEGIDPELQYPHPKSASVDHVLPIARGGGHIWGNVQAAHLACNIRKGAKTSEAVS